MMLRDGYLLAFALASAVCLTGLWRVHLVDDPDTRRGLSGLLLFAGVWAAAQVGQLVVPTLALKTAFYIGGLVVGLGAVWSWLYFCSAYVGRDYHRRPAVRAAAVISYVGIVLVKVTNPLHGRYFSATLVGSPFTHLAVEFGTLHWLVLGLSYALAGVGFYLLYSLFDDSGFDTTSLSVVAGLVALPALVDVAVLVREWPLAGVNHEPLGVAVFALGTLYFVEEKFVAVSTFGRSQAIDDLDVPVVLVDRDDRVHDYNAAAARAFPSLHETSHHHIDERLPVLACVEAGTVVTTGADGTTPRHYLYEESPLTVGPTRIGRVVVLTDVTRVVTQDREIQRQNEQLDDFATAITHELHNTLGIVRGNADLLASRLPSTAAEGLEAPLQTITETTDRMTRIVGDLATLARYGQTLDTVDECVFRETVQAAWERERTAGMSLTMDGTGTVTAAPDRLTELFREAFAFARETRTTRVTVRLTDDGFTITTDGRPLTGEAVTRVFDYDSPVPTAEVGLALPNVRTLASVHGWHVDVDPTYTDGVHLRVTGVAVVSTGDDEAAA